MHAGGAEDVVAARNEIARLDGVATQGFGFLQGVHHLRNAVNAGHHLRRPGREEDLREHPECPGEDPNVVGVHVPGEDRVQPAPPRPHPAEGLVGARNGVPDRHVRKLREQVLQGMPEARHANGHHGRGCPQRLQLEALVEELQAVIALGRTELRVSRLRKESRHRDTGMELQVLAHLAGAVREIPAALEQHRGRHAARGHHDHLRADPEAVPEAARERLCHLAAHAGHAGARVQDLLHLDRCQHPGTEPDGRRDVADVHALLGTIAATGEALATTPTASHVARDRLARVAERFAPGPEQGVAGPLDVFGRRADSEELAHRVVVAIELASVRPLEFETRRPTLEDRLRRAHADRRVDERTPSQGNRLHGRQDRAAGSAKPSLPHGARHRATSLEFEVGRREGGPLLEQQHLVAGFRDFVGDHPPTRPGADDDHVDLLLEVAVVLGEHANLSRSVFGAHRVSPAYSG